MNSDFPGRMLLSKIISFLNWSVNFFYWHGDSREPVRLLSRTPVSKPGEFCFIRSVSACRRIPVAFRPIDAIHRSFPELEARNFCQFPLQSHDGSHISIAGCRFGQVKDLGNFTVAQLFKVS